MVLSGLLHAELERNWACEQTDYQARLAEIKQMPHLASRSFERALLGTSHRLPQITDRILKRQVPGNLELLDAGSQHTVLADDQHVIKVNRRSVFISPAERDDLSDESTAAHTLLWNYIGSAVVPQTTEVNVNPLNHQTQAVQHTQDKVSYEPIDIFPPYGKRINIPALQSLLQEYPGIDGVLDDLSVAGLKMILEKDMVPDVSGPGNIGLKTNFAKDLVLLDGLPVLGRTDSRGVGRIAWLLSDLRFQLYNLLPR